MATGRLPDPNTAPVTAKGDLYTYSTVPAKLAVGNNGETLVADSSASTGLRYTAGNASGNPVINSAMQVWQRGTSISIPASTALTFTADRWQTATGANQAITISRQVTGDTTNLPNIQYALRYQRNSGQTGTSGLLLFNNFESVNSIPFAGKTITLSFYARAGANYSAASNLLNSYINTGTGTDQSPFSYTNATSVASTNHTLTTTWQRFTSTGTISASATQLEIIVNWNPTGTAGANDYFEITGVQLDIGSVALPFRTYSATLAGELAACQRYYVRFIGTGANDILSSLGWARTTTDAHILFTLPVEMRITPTAVETSTIELTDLVNEPAVGTVTLSGGSTSFSGQLNCATTGLTQFRPYVIRNDNNAAGYVAFTAEL